MRGAIVAALIATSTLAPATEQPGPGTDRGVVLVVVEGLTVGQVLRDPTLRGLAAAGGLGLLARADDEVLEPADVVPATTVVRAIEVPDGAAASRALRRTLADARFADVLVLVVASGATGWAGEPVTPVVMARGEPAELLRARGPVGGLTSATTRRPGVISDADLRPTVLAFLGRPVPEGSPGSPIRGAGEAPTALYRRFLEYRRVVLPVGLAALGIALAALLSGLVLLAGPWRAAPSLVRAVAVAGIFGVALQVALLPASWLPTFRPAVVWPSVVGMGAALAAVAMAVAGRRVGAPVIAVAGIGLALVVADSALGWPSLLTPLMGGSALDGVRFFGLGNAYAGMVLAGAVLLAALVPGGRGALVIGAAGLFAGLPFLGADLGGAITLFAVAGLWFGLRTRGRIGAREVVLVVAAAVLGLAVVTVSHGLWPVTEHVSRAAAAGPVGALGIFGDRLALNLRVTAGTPAVWPALALLPAGLLLAWRPVGPFAGPLWRDPAWRHAAAALAAGGIAGWLLNDTFGMGSVAFVYLAAALVYPPLEDRWTSG
ncbi:MAG TPA: hypothetical protein VHL78_04010 [Actinomycetota bacterium]|nr:hypothetical protein [Actinomycetota bacterium]